MALTVTITSPTTSSSTAYTLTGEVSGVAGPIDALTYRINGDGEVGLPLVVGPFSADVTIRSGGNTIAVHAVKAAEDVTEAIPVDVPDEFRGLTTGDELIQRLPRSIVESV